MTPTGCHTEDHERILAQVLVGDLDRNAPEVSTLVAECDECRANLEELTGLAALMEDEGAEERELLASLDYDRTAPGSDLVAPFFEARVAELPDPAPRPLTWLRVAAAAAILVSVGLWLMGKRLGVEAGPDQRVLLGGSALEFTGAVGDVADYATVRWQERNQSSASGYEITIFDATSDAERLPVVETLRVDQAEWTPTDEQLRSLPDAIELEVAPLDVTGNFVGASGSVSVSRSH